METRYGKATVKPQSAKKKSSKDLKQTQDPNTGADMEAKLQVMLDTLYTKISTDIGSLRTEVNNNIETLRTEDV